MEQTTRKNHQIAPNRLAGRLWAVLLFLVVFLLSSFAFSLESQSSGVDLSNEQTVMLIIENGEAGKEAGIAAHAAKAGHLLLALLPTNLASGVISAEASPLFLQKPIRKWSGEKLNRIFNAFANRRPASQTGNVSAAIEMAMDYHKNKTGEAKHETLTLFLILTSPMPEEPSDPLLQKLTHSKLRLNVLHVTHEVPLIWRQTASMRSGIPLAVEEKQALPNALLTLYRRAFSPQQIPLDGDVFRVDHVSSKVQIVTTQRKKEPVRLMGPENRRYWKNYYNRQRGEAVEFETLGKVVLITLTNPLAGRWRLKNVDLKTTSILTDSRMSLRLLLPRKKYTREERLHIAAYLARDGKIARLPAPAYDISVTAELLAKDGKDVSSTPLFDNGKPPDTIKGDGVYTGEMPLLDASGAHQVRVTARSQEFSRKTEGHITIIDAIWAVLLQPKPPLILKQTPSVLVELSPLVSLDTVDAVTARLGWYKNEIHLRPNPDHPNLYEGDLPPPAWEGKTNLIITKKSSTSELISDVQRKEFPFTVTAGKDVPYKAEEQKPRKSGDMFWIKILFVFFTGTLLTTAGFFLWKYLLQKPVVQEEEEEEDYLDRGGFPDIPEESFSTVDEPGSVFEPPVEEEASQPMRNQEDIENALAHDVGDRIEEVVAVHRQATVKGSKEKPELRPEDLDRDSDPNYVSGIGFDGFDPFADSMDEDLDDFDVPDIGEGGEDNEENLGSAFENLFNDDDDSK